MVFLQRKRVFVLLAVVFLLLWVPFLVVGCGGGGGDNNTSSSSTTNNSNDNNGGGGEGSSSIGISYWAKTYEGSGGGSSYTMQVLPNGDILLGGHVSSSDFGAWLLKLTNSKVGEVVLSKMYIRDDVIEARSVCATSDGGYIIATATNSHYLWIIKVNSKGEVIWQRRYGKASGSSNPKTIIEVSDGYIIGATTSSYGAGKSDLWVLKIDKNGNTVWGKTYGSGNTDALKCLIKTSDGEYLVCGFTDKDGGSKRKIICMKLASNGAIAWQRVYDGIGCSSGAESVCETSDGKYVVVGSGGAVLKLDDENGDIIWAKYINSASAYSVCKTSDGGCALTGYTRDFGKGGDDIYAAKLNSLGEIVWQKTYGGTKNDDGYAIHQTSDGGFLIAGITHSYGETGSSAWVIKTDSNGNCGDLDATGLAPITTPTCNSYNVNMTVNEASPSGNNVTCTVKEVEVKEKQQVP